MNVILAYDFTSVWQSSWGIGELNCIIYAHIYAFTLSFGCLRSVCGF